MSLPPRPLHPRSLRPAIGLAAAVMLVTGCQFGAGASATAATLSVVAGRPSGQGFADGPVGAARFSYPAGMARDPQGGLVVVDGRNEVLRRIDPQGLVTTIAGATGWPGSADGGRTAARFNYPADVAAAPDGTLYVADSQNHVIRRITPDGQVSTFAGAPGQAGSADGRGAAARFNDPSGLALDAEGNLLVADTMNCTIRRISPDGTVTTLAGVPGAWSFADGPGAQAMFSAPVGLAVDRTGRVLVADQMNHVIRVVARDGTVSTLAGAAGQGGDVDGTGAAARLNGPSGLAIDAAGTIYVAENWGNVVRRLTPDGRVTTLAGDPAHAGTNDGVGAAARFRALNRISVDASGTLTVTDNNSMLRTITPDGRVTTWAGSPPQWGSADGPGGANGPARFSFPNGIAVDAQRTIHVADQDNGTLRTITPGGVVRTLAGTPGVWGWADGQGAAAQFAGPGGVAVDAAGNQYVSEFSSHVIRKVTPDGTVTTFAGQPWQAGSQDGPASQARFNGPNNVLVDRAGNVYVADYLNNEIRRITPDGTVSTLAGSTTPGSADGRGAAARFNGPNSLAMDAAGNLYVTDSNNDTVRRIAPDGQVSTLAGAPGIAGSADGAGATARFAYPWGLAIDRAGNLYVADSGNNAVRRIAPDGRVSTFVGRSGPYANQPGPLPGGLAYPVGVAIDPVTDDLLLTLPDAVMRVPTRNDR